MNDIFLSYRKDDAQTETLLLFEYLARHFGIEHVFLDREIPLGDDFRVSLDERVRQCRVLVAVIGPDWLNEVNKKRLHDPADWVRRELETALAVGKPVVPVFVRGAKPPSDVDLPAGRLGDGFSAAQGKVVHTDNDFLADMSNVCKRLAECTRLPQRGRRNGLTVFFVSLSVVLLVVLIGFIVFFRMTHVPIADLHQAESAALTRLKNDELFLFQELRRRDPVSFKHQDGESIELARILPDRNALAQVDLKDIISKATSSIDILVYTGYFLINENESRLEEPLKRNVRVRILLMNEQSPNQAQFDAAAFAMLSPGGKTATVRSQANDVRRILGAFKDKVQGDKGTYRGTLEVRWYDFPVFYSLILRDPHLDTRFLQVGVYLYKNQSDRPYYQCSIYGKDLIDNMQRQFDEMWSRSN